MNKMPNEARAKLSPEVLRAAAEIRRFLTPVFREQLREHGITQAQYAQAIAELDLDRQRRSERIRELFRQRDIAVIRSLREAGQRKVPEVPAVPPKS
jgi:hypothetical protein